MHNLLRKTVCLLVSSLCLATHSWGFAQEFTGGRDIATGDQYTPNTGGKPTRVMPVQFRDIARVPSSRESHDHSPAPTRTASRTKSQAVNSTTGLRRAEVRQASHQVEAPLPLARPRASQDGQAAKTSLSGQTRGSLATFTTACLVVGVACAIVWLARRGLPASRGRLPADALECLGRATLGPKLEVHLLRIGGKLLLVGSSANSHQTLTEITDPDEVERIVAACGTERGASVAASMQRALSQLDSQPGSTSIRHPRRTSREIADA